MDSLPETERKPSLWQVPSIPLPLSLDSRPPDDLDWQNTWQVSVWRHSQALARARRRFGGEVFARAPFDLVDGLGRFIEVKVARYRYRKNAHQWRVSFTSTEIRFLCLKEVHLYVEWGDNISLIPTEIWSDRLRNRKLQRSPGGEDKWSVVFEIPLDDLDRFMIHGIPTDMRRRLAGLEGRSSGTRRSG